MSIDTYEALLSFLVVKFVIHWVWIHHCLWFWILLTISLSKMYSVRSCIESSTHHTLSEKNSTSKSSKYSYSRGFFLRHHRTTNPMIAHNNLWFILIWKLFPFVLNQLIFYDPGFRLPDFTDDQMDMNHQFLTNKLALSSGGKFSSVRTSTMVVGSSNLPTASKWSMSLRIIRRTKPSGSLEAS